MEEARKNDCLLLFSKYLKSTGVLTESLEKEMEDEIIKEVNEATEYAENAPDADANTLLNYVYEN